MYDINDRYVHFMKVMQKHMVSQPQYYARDCGHRSDIGLPAHTSRSVGSLSELDAGTVTIVATSESKEKKNINESNMDDSDIDIDMTRLSSTIPAMASTRQSVTRERPF